MTISYPLALPASVSTRRVVFKQRSAVGVAQSPWDYSMQMQPHAGQAWIASVEYPMLTEAQAEEMEAFLLSLNGMEGTFLLGDPLRTEPRGTASGAPLVMGGGQTGRALATDGWTASESGVLLAGDYFQLQNRLYRVLQDVDADGDGEAVLDIFPRLRESPADNDTLLLNNCVGTFRLASNENVIMDVGPDRYYSLSFSAIEAL